MLALLPQLGLHAQGIEVGAKAVSKGPGVLDMLARGGIPAARDAAPAPVADSPAPAPVTAPQRSRLVAPSKAAGAAEEDSHNQLQAEAALRPKRLFLSQADDCSAARDGGSAVQSSQPSLRHAGRGGKPARQSTQQDSQSSRHVGRGSAALRQMPEPAGYGVGGQPSKCDSDDVIDLVTPPSIMTPDGGRDGKRSPRLIVLSSLSSSEATQGMPLTASGDSGACPDSLTAAAAVSSRLTKGSRAPGRSGAACEAVATARVGSLPRNKQPHPVSVQGSGRHSGATAEAGSQAVIGISAAHVPVRTPEPTRGAHARDVQINSTPFSDIMIVLDTPTTGQGFAQTPALAQ